MKYLSPFNSNHEIGAFSRNSFANLEKEFESLFGRLPGLLNVDSDSFADSGDPSLKSRWFENDDAFVAQIELPGVNPKDVRLEVSEDALKLSAERQSRSKKSDAGSSISYKQSFSIPEGVETDKISARHEEGVLSVTLPKVEVLKPRQIKIN